MKYKKTDDILCCINENMFNYLDNIKDKQMYLPMKYSLEAGGKRFRPMLLALTYDAFYEDEKDDIFLKDIIPFAVAIEYIHTYSLIHDDLPAMDNDDYRRGKLSCHKKYDEATAILAGDGLLNLAYETMTTTIQIMDKKDKGIDAMKEIATCSGVSGMIDGQALDMLYENKRVDEDKLLKMYENKTGKLIKASMKCGAILSSANSETISKIDDISKDIGLAFQIKDDILDIVGNEKKIGKPKSSDIKNKKSTYISIHSLEKAMDYYKILVNSVLDKMNDLGLRDKLIYNYINMLMERDY